MAFLPISRGHGPLEVTAEKPKERVQTPCQGHQATRHVSQQTKPAKPRQKPWQVVQFRGTTGKIEIKESQQIVATVCLLSTPSLEGIPQGTAVQ